MWSSTFEYPRVPCIYRFSTLSFNLSMVVNVLWKRQRCRHRHATDDDVFLNLLRHMTSDRHVSWAHGRWHLWHKAGPSNGLSERDSLGTIFCFEQRITSDAFKAFINSFGLLLRQPVYKQNSLLPRLLAHKRRRK